MADIILISDNTLGGAECVTEHLAEKLEEADLIIETLRGSLSEGLFASGIWLVISLIHGAGDIPDSLPPFCEVLREQKPNPLVVRFDTIDIGSREYDTFCGTIDKIEVELKSPRAGQAGGILRINIFDHGTPEDPAGEWLESWISLLK